MTTNSFTLPSMGDSWANPGYYENTGESFVAESPSWTDTASYENTGESFVGDLFTDTGSVAGEENTWASSVWDWANTETGSSVIGGAISGAGSVWAADQKADYLSESDDKSYASQMALAQLQQDGAKERLQMQLDAEESTRKRHNKSINAPVNMTMRTFK